ncbi:FixH family protein [Salipaludibacillus sp. CUR1]|uniref:FixH family protein n=1 Tax=Salipaludibacillus sp. CUR1 TaxID=2820003 RepID=UPI001E43CD03|nr:FixH family protein [Salipaludibacillus sp. CUR1]MCE7792253.1 FixH family protein [Salipaludibacillus sp. CUR1]
MKYVRFIAFIISLSIILAACGQSETESENNGPVSVNDINTEQLEVELIIPETADPGDEISLEALVTQGDEKVDDASEVIFEVWIDGEKSDSDMIEADYPGEDGMYEVTYEFTEEEIYMVQPHVTARGMHVMPVGEIAVGDAEPRKEDGNNEAQEDNGDHNHGDTNEENDHGHSHEDGGHDHVHLHEAMSVDLKTEQPLQAGEEASLLIEAEWEESLWTGGEVQFEVWTHGDERREWLEAEETEKGIYEVIHSFDEPGEYHVMVHLEDDELHEHIQFMVDVE